METLLYYLRALSQMYQHMHWRVSGDQYYGDHLLYERLYDGVNEELDVVAEKAIGVADDSNAVKPNEDAETSTNILSKMISDDDSSNDFPQKAIAAEQGLMKVIRSLMEKGQSDGVEDMLQGIASKHEEHLYLLQQRNRTAAISPAARLYKLAYHLDLQGLHSEADAIAKVMKSLSERVGINVEDMVALADHFDSEGNYEMADKFDKMAQEYDSDKDPYLNLDQEDVFVGKEDPYIGLHQDVMVEKILKSFKEGEISLTEAIEKLTGDLNAYTEADSLMKSVEESLGSEASKKKSLAKAKHPPPKKWFEKMKKEVQKGRKGKKKYSDEELGGIIGEIWYNRLKDKKRKTIYNRHGKSKDPNK